jgi:hypothetical protein
VVYWSLILQNSCNANSTLGCAERRSVQEQHEKGAARHQAIFSLDYGTYQNLIRAFDIRKSLIPHRNDEEATQVNARGWYG